MNVQQALTKADAMRYYVSHNSSKTAQALQTLAAELRRLTELRGMDEVPVYHDAVIVYSDGNTPDIAEYGHGEWAFSDDGEPMDAGEFKGWLPLPAPSNAGAVG